MELSTYHYPMVMYIKPEDPDLPAFYYDPIIFPMTAVGQDMRNAGVPELSQEELDDFELPEEVEAFLPVSHPPFGMAGSPIYSIMAMYAGAVPDS